MGKKIPRTVRKKVPAPKILSASSRSFLPKAIAAKGALPPPTSILKAEIISKSGTLIPNPFKA